MSNVILKILYLYYILWSQFIVEEYHVPYKLYVVQLDIGAQLSLFLVCNFFSLFLILFLCYKTQCIVKKQYMLLFIAGDSCVIEWRNVQLHNQSESK